eukprot:3513728-Rhodomonas_salina.1
MEAHPSSESCSEHKCAVCKDCIGLTTDAWQHRRTRDSTLKTFDSTSQLPSSHSYREARPLSSLATCRSCTTPCTHHTPASELAETERKKRSSHSFAPE